MISDESLFEAERAWLRLMAKQASGTAAETGGILDESIIVSDLILFSEPSFLQ